MKKNFKWLLSVLIAVFAVSMIGNTAFAEESKSFEDGTYEVEYDVVYAGDDEIPEGLDLNEFFEQPATLVVEDGVQSIQLEHTAPDQILSLTVDGGDVEVVDEDDETRVVKFEVGDLADSVSVDLNMFYGSTHPTQVDFDVSEVPLKDDDGEEPEEEPNGDEEEPNGNEENGEDNGEGTTNGAGEDNGDNGNGTTGGEQEENPQTGDKSNILLYSFLLVGALVPLAIIVRRRFV